MSNELVNAVKLIKDECKFCRHDDTTPILSDSEWEVEVWNTFYANQLYIESGSGNNKYVDINYCPMCGRKL